ncbi:MAG: family tricarboxylate transporter, receptor protein [Hyphomicrobiales bacterium]|nr:family tricarboxylate transporter, receptor protein [Hyphomicrobiales bacterium]
MSWFPTRRAVAFCTALATLSPGAVLAQAPSVEAFYKGKTISLIVPFTAGGLNDLAARLVARHLDRYIPGKPTIVVQNQPSAGGLALANRFANSIDKDGLTLAIMGRALPQFQIMGDPNANFDPLKFTWLGSLSSYANDAYMLLLNTTAAAKTADDLRKPGPATPLGANRTGSTNVTFALLARDVLKLNVQVVRGFPGATDITLAMQRGEVEGQTIDLSAVMSGQRDLWTSKKVRPVVQFGRLTRMADMPDVPTGRELVSDPKDSALLAFAELPFFMAMPFAGPPEIPADRVKALQEGFMAMTKDPAFLADAQKIGIDISAIDGNAVRKLIEDASKTPPDVLARFKKLVAE